MRKKMVLVLIVFLVMALMVTPVFAKKGGDKGGKGQEHVYVCFKGKTKFPAAPAAENMIRKGGYWGPCFGDPDWNWLYIPIMVR